MPLILDPIAHLNHEPLAVQPQYVKSVSREEIPRTVREHVSRLIGTEKVDHDWVTVAEYAHGDDYRTVVARVYAARIEYGYEIND